MIVILILISLPDRKAGEAESIARHYRTLWNFAGPQSYQIELEIVSPPVPIVGLALTIREEKIAQKSILACDRPSEEYPASLCEPVRLYYSAIGNLTVEDLFELANDCTRKMRAALKNCPAFAEIESDDGISLNELVDAVQACPNDLKSHASVCAVAYDVNLGYPKSISQVMPGALDSFSSIKVKAITTVP